MIEIIIMKSCLNALLVKSSFVIEKSGTEKINYSTFTTP